MALPGNSNLFWEFVNSARQFNPLPEHINYNGRSINDNNEIANCFADFFEAVYVHHPNSHLNFSYANVLDGVSNLSIDIGEIFREVDSLGLNKGPGYDTIYILFF